MNKKKQHQYDKLQKSSILFTQLGLVLALVVVYLALEFSTVKEITMLPNNYDPDEVVLINITPTDVIIKRKKKSTVQPKIEKKIPLIHLEVVPDDTDFATTVLNNPEEAPKINFDDFSEAPDIEEIDPDEKIPFILIEEAPIYPGCEGLDSLAAKQCFTKKISKFVNKRFDTSLAERLNVSGKQRIWVEFTVDKTGNIVDIAANSPHKSLIKEAVRVVEKLPQMTPGKQRKRAVGVKYTLPIVFFIE